MDDRTINMKPDRLERKIENPKKHTKRSKKGSVKVNKWCTEERNEINSEPVPEIDFTPVFWQQSGASPHVQPLRNSQRLFTAMSDPSVCGYSTVPVAYAMEPVSMPPVYPLYRPVPQPNYRAFRGKVRRNIHNQMGSRLHQSNLINGYSSLQENRPNFMTSPIYQNGDYTSLPPTANNHTTNDTEELNSEHRRYSDPGLGPADLPPYTHSEDSDSGESGSSITTIGKNNKLVLSLVEQMTALREVNSQMFKQLHETKMSLESVKAELGRMKHQVSVEYQPGMLSDMISEIRQANKMLEESIITRINTVVEEKNQQNLLELKELRDRLAQITEEKAVADKRIVKLEEEVAALKMTNNDDQEIAALEEETLTLRRELQEARAPRNIIPSHSAKCVDAAVTRTIIPVTFDTLIKSSTPVRTNIHETRRFSSMGSGPPSSSSSSSTSSSSSSSVSTSSSSSPLSHSDSLRNLESINGSKDIKEKMPEKINNKDQERRKESVQSLEPDEKEALEKLIHFHFNREQRLAQSQDASTKKTETCRQKSEGANNLKKFSDNYHVNNVSRNSTSSSSSSGSDSGADERFNGKNGKLDKNQRKNGVVEVPDVVVVAGKSMVPKHLCSTRILPPKVLNAPPHTTYTTAYI
ncbi:pinin-like isoform X2 [Chelonus insularis]|uniref:pinin-like isoform X2 n=1 Tax=Chelonus insularis TaxID=460826 RepID=UPI00158E54CA|nr:pinin-like isoform X2 [Chelonus insularis]XP_034944260.1 pinin-like isoform X2 [Chelonus insularis]